MMNDDTKDTFFVNEKKMKRTSTYLCVYYDRTKSLQKTTRKKQCKKK